MNANQLVVLVVVIDALIVGLLFAALRSMSWPIAPAITMSASVASIVNITIAISYMVRR